MSKLHEYLASEGLKPIALARKAGCNPSTLSRYMTGRGSLSEEMKQRISQATDGKVQPGDLVRLHPGDVPPKWQGPIGSYLANEGLRASRFAERVGCSAAALSLYMNGKNGLSDAMKRRISEATGGKVKPGDLLKLEPGEGANNADQP